MKTMTRTKTKTMTNARPRLRPITDKYKYQTNTRKYKTTNIINTKQEKVQDKSINPDPIEKNIPSTKLNSS